jgi:hypothetical protein
MAQTLRRSIQNAGREIPRKVKKRAQKGGRKRTGQRMSRLVLAKDVYW